MAILYKLPAPVLDSFRSVLDAVDWANTPSVELDIGHEEIKPTLEVIQRRGQIIVRPGSAKAAILLRRFADEITAADPAKYPPPSAEAVALVLERRNPKTEKPKDEDSAP